MSKAGNDLNFDKIKQQLEESKKSAEIPKTQNANGFPLAEEEPKQQQETFLINIVAPEKVEKKVYNLYFPTSLIERIKKGAKMYSGKDNNSNQSAFVEQILDQVLRSIGI